MTLFEVNLEKNNFNKMSQTTNRIYSNDYGCTNSPGTWDLPVQESRKIFARYFLSSKIHGQLDLVVSVILGYWNSPKYSS